MARNKKLEITPNPFLPWGDNEALSYVKNWLETVSNEVKEARETFNTVLYSRGFMDAVAYYSDEVIKGEVYAQEVKLVKSVIDGVTSFESAKSLIQELINQVKTSFINQGLSAVKNNNQFAEAVDFARLNSKMNFYRRLAHMIDGFDTTLQGVKE